MKETQLGKIRSVKFGFGGYQDCQVGLSLDFEFKGSGCGTFVGGSWNFGPDAHAKWTLDDQTKAYGETMRKIVELMKKAKVDDVTKLKDIPVEVTFNNMVLDSWRVLEEVL